MGILFEGKNTYVNSVFVHNTQNHMGHSQRVRGSGMYPQAPLATPLIWGLQGNEREANQINPPLEALGKS